MRSLRLIDGVAFACLTIAMIATAMLAAPAPIREWTPALVERQLTLTYLACAYLVGFIAAIGGMWILHGREFGR